MIFLVRSAAYPPRSRHLRAIDGSPAHITTTPARSEAAAGMTAGGLDKADVVASMFDNVTKCMQDNAALLRRLHASGALLSTAEGKDAAKRKRAATKEEKVVRMT